MPGVLLAALAALFEASETRSADPVQAVELLLHLLVVVEDEGQVVRGLRARDADGARGIGIRQRAWPLLEMMRRSLAQRADIVWGV